MRKADLALIAEIRRQLADGSAKRARIAAKIRQCEIAKAIGVSASTVSQWEAGLRVPSAEHALEYGRLLKQLGKKAA